jgi:hypothetical protein
MSNAFTFHRSKLDEIVESLSDEERLTLMIEGDYLERNGSTCDGILRKKTTDIMEELSLGTGKFDATWMKMIITSCHKIQSIRTLEAEMQPMEDPAP